MVLFPTFLRKIILCFGYMGIYGAITFFTDLTVPVEVNYKKGDAVRVELNLETFKALQRENGGWVDAMEEVGVIADRKLY